MNLSRVDLNLLVYLDVLLRERNVTRAAQQLGITQPALSNGLRRLRELFQDPLLVRTSEGMMPTERARALQPQIRQALAVIQQAVAPEAAFDALQSQRMFRIMASDYAESALLNPLLFKLRDQAPHICLDILTPGDGSFQDLEQGGVDMAINRFDQLPPAFHQMTLWHDDFACLLSQQNPLADNFDLEGYLRASHIWVSKAGIGIGRDMIRHTEKRLGWVDEALAAIGQTRRIRVFTRHYQVAALLAAQPDLIATLPEQLAWLHATDNRLCIRKPPFMINPIELQMAWSPLVQHDSGHMWLRRLISETAREIIAARSGEKLGPDT